MIQRPISLALALMPAFFGVTACSAETWYRGIQNHAENECNREPAGEREGCLRRVNTLPYQEYERNRLQKSD